ncbi:hypothetical protein [Haloarcula salina]|uniref:Uncharacterized protein n=1 Tax=Haloarcula salina TaxID=1429914 RepID=A0AA41FYB9_9EURY|nr:hypothetical protein [Haloarcula salina]MBV0900164.1 hypothetical protein [Haloarcula salina]
MTRRSKREIERALDDIEVDSDGTEFDEMVFTDGDGEVWGRVTDDGIEEATVADIPGLDSADDVRLVADFTAGGEDS